MNATIKKAEDDTCISNTDLMHLVIWSLCNKAFTLIHKIVCPSLADCWFMGCKDPELILVSVCIAVALWPSRWVKPIAAKWLPTQWYQRIGSKFVVYTLGRALLAEWGCVGEELSSSHVVLECYLSSVPVWTKWLSDASKQMGRTSQNIHCHNIV